MVKAYAGADRRRHYRGEEEISLMYQSPEGKKVEISTTKNISGGGVCFETEIYIPPAATVEVQVNKPINGGLKAILPVRAKARVVWIRQAETGKYKLGLEFVNIEERHREEIIRNVEEISKAE